MSTELIKQQMAQFLENKEPRVICIRGKWGVGKTHTWTKQLEAAQAKHSIALPRYSYVSLFGINSLEALKFAIFENVITLSGGVKAATLETLDARVSQLGSWRKLTGMLQHVPLVKSFVGTDMASRISFMTVRDQIVCIDDVERRGKGLNISDVLGLISHLREQCECKIVLILNDEQLDDCARKAFEKNLEKVADVSLAYEPPPTVSVKIAIPGTDDTSQHVAERCTALGITNIRAIQRIVRYVDAIAPMLKDFDIEVLNTAVNSIALFSWARDHPDDAPSLDYLRGRNNFLFGYKKREQMSPQEIAWDALLQSYGYGMTDGFDRVLMDGVCDGYFDIEQVRKEAQTVHQKVLAGKADGSFEDAWRRYHDSFADNRDEVLDGLFTSFMNNYEYITPTNLNGTVALFKELGRPEQAEQMLEQYVENRKEGRDFFDLDEHLFEENISDADVRDAFMKKAAQVEESRDIPSLMLAIENRRDDKIVEALSSAPVEEYRKAFKAHSGQMLRKMLANVFRYDRVINAPEHMKEISRRAKEALELIGAESPINARRVRRYGIKLDSEE